MKYLKHLICMVMMLFLLLPGAAASESKGEGVNLQEILWGHIKDSYEWHVTNIGDKPIIINLPVIVKTSNGWYTGCFYKDDSLHVDLLLTALLQSPQHNPCTNHLMSSQ